MRVRIRSIESVMNDPTLVVKSLCVRQVPIIPPAGVIDPELDFMIVDVPVGTWGGREVKRTILGREIEIRPYSNAYATQDLSSYVFKELIEEWLEY